MPFRDFAHVKIEQYAMYAWGEIVLTKTLLRSFIGSNRVYYIRRSFSESFRTSNFYFSLCGCGQHVRVDWCYFKGSLCAHIRKANL